MNEILKLRRVLGKFPFSVVARESKLPRQTVVDFLTGHINNPTFKTIEGLKIAATSLKQRDLSKQEPSNE